MSEPWREWRDPRVVLREHGLKPSRRHSQNFLVAPGVVEAIADAVGEVERVVEIGPGLGTLTSELLRRGIEVIALEKDPRMLEVLEVELRGAPVKLVAGDATELDLGELASTPIDLVGNLPYAITGAVMRRLVAQVALLKRATIMVQKEVRDRLLAEPGTKSWGALAAFTRNVFDVVPIRVVEPGSFHPAPRVRSAVVSLVPRAQPWVHAPLFEATVRAVFAQRRKTLRNALRAAFDPAAVQRVMESYPDKVRGETLDLPELGLLARRLEECGVEVPSDDRSQPS